jgi:hypothetical protein
MLRFGSLVSKRCFSSSLKSFELSSEAKSRLDLYLDHTKPLLKETHTYSKTAISLSELSYLVKRSRFWPETFADKKRVLEAFDKEMDKEMDKMDKNYTAKEEIWMDVSYDSEWLVQLLQAWGFEARLKQVGNHPNEEAFVISLPRQD